MPELDAQHRAQLAETLADVDGVYETSESRDAWIEYFRRHADALAPLVAEWLADAWEQGAKKRAFTDPACTVQHLNPYREVEPVCDACPFAGCDDCKHQGGSDDA